MSASSDAPNLSDSSSSPENEVIEVIYTDKNKENSSEIGDDDDDVIKNNEWEILGRVSYSWLEDVSKKNKFSLVDNYYVLGKLFCCEIFILSSSISAKGIPADKKKLAKHLAASALLIRLGITKSHLKSYSTPNPMRLPPDYFTPQNIANQERALAQSTNQEAPFHIPPTNQEDPFQIPPTNQEDPFQITPTNQGREISNSPANQRIEILNSTNKVTCDSNSTNKETGILNSTNKVTGGLNSTNEETGGLNSTNEESGILKLTNEERGVEILPNGQLIFQPFEVTCLMRDSSQRFTVFNFNEWAIANGFSSPQFEELGFKGPSHAPTWRIKCTVRDKSGSNESLCLYASGQGRKSQIRSLLAAKMWYKCSEMRKIEYSGPPVPVGDLEPDAIYTCESTLQPTAVLRQVQINPGLLTQRVANVSQNYVVNTNENDGMVAIEEGIRSLTRGEEFG